MNNNELEEAAKSLKIEINTPSDGRFYNVCNQPTMSIVGNCPHCGGPIYSYKTLFVKDTPVVKFSCNCRNDGGRGMGQCLSKEHDFQIKQG